MAVWHCAECTAAYSVGAPRCPECGSVVRVNEATQPEEEDKDMAKVTVHGGPSNEAADEQAEGSEQPSADGTDSSASSETEQTSPQSSETKPPLPARKTASRSRKARTDSSSAAGTDGDQEADTSASND